MGAPLVGSELRVLSISKPKLKLEVLKKSPA